MTGQVTLFVYSPDLSCNRSFSPGSLIYRTALSLPSYLIFSYFLSYFMNPDDGNFIRLKLFFNHEDAADRLGFPDGHIRLTGPSEILDVIPGRLLLKVQFLLDSKYASIIIIDPVKLNRVFSVRSVRNPDPDIHFFPSLVVFPHV